MGNNKTNGKETLEKYNKLSEEERLNFWSGLLLLLALEDNTAEEDGE